MVCCGMMVRGWNIRSECGEDVGTDCEDEESDTDW
jgi:hypothetical protein